MSITTKTAFKDNSIIFHDHFKLSLNLEIFRGGINLDDWAYMVLR